TPPIYVVHSSSPRHPLQAPPSPRSWGVVAAGTGLGGVADERDSHCPYLLSSKTTAKGMGSHAARHLSKLDSSLQL
uniref:Uncharacterized protein n=1 Tax=Xenopus tropicalis TaxID=8364 RepID=A0A803JDC4_XENTR